MARTLLRDDGMDQVLERIAAWEAAGLIDAVSYVVSAIALLGSPRPAKADKPASSPVGLLDGMGDGLRRVAGDQILRDLAGSTAVFNLGSGMILAVLVLFATQDAHEGMHAFIDKRQPSYKGH